MGVAKDLTGVVQQLSQSPSEDFNTSSFLRGYSSLRVTMGSCQQCLDFDEGVGVML